MLGWSWSEKRNRRNSLSVLETGDAFIDDQIGVSITVVVIHTANWKLFVHLNGNHVKKGKLDLHMVIIWAIMNLIAITLWRWHFQQACLCLKQVCANVLRSFVLSKEHISCLPVWNICYFFHQYLFWPGTKISLIFSKVTGSLKPQIHRQNWDRTI